MSRHLIAAHFGPLDTAAIPAATDEVVTHFDLLAGKTSFGHGLTQALDQLAKLRLTPSEVAIDLIVVAALVHAADTRIPRSAHSQDDWTREIRLVVPVSDLDAWHNAAHVVEQLLNFLTGDRWSLGFRARPLGFDRTARASNALPTNPFDGISLFSGGLDSLIGAIDSLEKGESPLFVSHAGDGATSSAQIALFEGLKGHYTSLSPERFRVWMTFKKNLVADGGPEDTTRGRSFLFFALGVLAGSGLGVPFTVRAPENGLIALNVPLDPLRLGSLSTRTTHPFYIARWNGLLTKLGIPARIENPYRHQTKGEMVAGCSNRPLLTSLVPLSQSCSSPTKSRWLSKGEEHCGYCVPCLIRRAALLRGLGSVGDPTAYTLVDLEKGALKTRQAQGQQIRSFQFAIERLRGRPELARLLIFKPGPLRDVADAIEDLASVYLRGMQEVGELLADTRTRPS